MTTRKAAGAAGDVVPISTTNSKLQSQSPTQQSIQSPAGVPAELAEMVGEFRDWCLKTYGDSGKTKTVTRRKYNKILQTLLQDGEEDGGGALLQEREAGGHHINAKFKFWVRSKGFQVGRSGASSDGPPVLYVPIKATCVDGVSGGDSSLKRVAVVEDFFDIIYAMHVELGTDPGKTPKHAGQKKTYKAIAETYAFLPREAVTRFLMSCGECQKRMHISPAGQDFKENNRPASLVSEVIDFNVPLTTTYMKQMKLHFMNNNNKDDSSLSSEEEAEMSEPTWLAPDLGAVSDLSPASRGERMRHSPQNTHSKDDDDDLSSESGSGNGLPALTPPTSAVTDGAIVRETEVVNGAVGAAPLDFSRPTSSSSSSEDQQPVNLSEPPSQRLPLSTSHLPITVSAAAAALLGALHPNAPEELRRKYPLAAKPPLAPHPALPLPHAHTPNTHAPSHTHTTELRLDRDGRDYGSKSPQYSSGGSYDGIKMELNAEDLTTGRHSTQVAPDDDDDDHDDHDDSDKINDTEGVDPERLKAFNMFVRLFVDENLDRMVPISKQPKEKIQAIIESCSRQFPEFQERARKRIRTYLKSCRRMKKNGMETRPTPPHLTSAMAENILAAACESESRNAAKRMRLEAYHDEQISLEKPSSGGATLREPVSLAHSAYSLAASAFPSQDTQLYINGAGLSYGYRGYPGLSSAIQHPISLTTGTATQSNGPTDLSMKSLYSNNITNSSSSTTTNNLSGRGGGGGGGGGASTQLSQPEITAVRQLIAGYRESAAFLLRSADELENLILQQN
ncbi:PREDICTED: nucleolar protein 4-like [Cyprinodon variegatus]|uniref:nucleolar protein 4-like n=1 Tax=Cyprinodon variegatus TaxID=28743 RepID=UPI0007429548|nr:PREDICTED: nucleolar protein 4-like [Cyprinodon variegatus]